MAKSKKFLITLPIEGYETLESLAKRERRPIADVIRQALEEYAVKQGIHTDFSVDRGGYRERKTTDEETS